MNEHSENTSSTGMASDLLVGFCGAATCLLTAAILWLVELKTGFAFYSWTFWFIIPAGALLAGMVGASGYYAGARIFNRRPGTLLLLNVLLASVGTFFVIHYLSYSTLEIGGKSISDFVSFGEYLDITIRSTALQFRHRAHEMGATKELGGWGYGLAILQVLGFTLGGLAVYAILTSIPYCERCSRYFSADGTQTRYTSDGEALQAFTAQLFNDFAEGAVATATEKHAAFGNAKSEKGDNLRCVIEVRRCKKCDQRWVKYTVEKLAGNQWKEVSELTTKVFTDEPVHV